MGLHGGLDRKHAGTHRMNVQSAAQVKSAQLPIAHKCEVKPTYTSPQVHASHVNAETGTGLSKRIEPG